MPLYFTRKMPLETGCEVIVTGAPKTLLPCPYSNLIFSAAGNKLKAACAALAPCETGNAVLTGGFGTGAKYIIHAVGPLWVNGFQNEEKLLISCYIKAMKLALEKNAASIAFPLLSVGTYSYPVKKAFTAAIRVLTKYAAACDMDIYLHVYDKDTAEPDDAADLNNYTWRTKEHTDFNIDSELPSLDDMFFDEPKEKEKPAPAVLSDVPFYQRVLELAEKKGVKAKALRLGANLTRERLAPIKNGCLPDWRRAAALCFSLGLDDAKTRELFSACGICVPDSVEADIIFWQLHKKADVFSANSALYYYGFPILC